MLKGGTGDRKRGRCSGFHGDDKSSWQQNRGCRVINVSEVLLLVLTVLVTQARLVHGLVRRSHHLLTGAVGHIGRHHRAGVRRHGELGKQHCRDGDQTQ